MDSGPAIRARNLRRVAAVVACVVAVTIFAAAVIVAGVALAAMLVKEASTEEWNRRGDAGDSFGAINTVLSGLAFLALIVTLWIQFHELRLQRSELRMQREAIERSNTELERSAAAGMRALHVELLKMSIDDERLAAIWPDAQSVPPDQYRQYLYANLIFQHIALSMQVFGYTELQMRPYIRQVFESPIIREYWAWSADARARTYIPGTTDLNSRPF